MSYTTVDIVKASEKLQPFITSSISYSPALVRPRSDKRVRAATLWPLQNGGNLLTNVEDQLVVLVNKHRNSIGLGGLQRDSGGALDYTALWKGEDLALWQYLAHDQTGTGSPKAGTTIYDRFAGCGYPTNAAWGENLAYAFLDPQSVMTAWLSDSGHRQNIENPSWTYIGVSVVQATNGLIFWTQDFGTVHVPVGTSPVPDPTPTPKPTVPEPAKNQVWLNPKKIKHTIIETTASAVGHKPTAKVRNNTIALTWTPLTRFKNTFTYVSG